MREGVEEQEPVMLLVQHVARLDHRDELDGDEVRALVEQLEHRVLRVRADPAPGDRRGGAADGLASDRHALAVRLHLKLLEIGGKQAKPLIIGKGRARLGTAVLRVVQVGEGGERGRVLVERRQPEMPVHLARALQQFPERVPAELDRGREADRRP